jgi:LuxR family maltose regulon positive regulatory protein
VIQFLAVKAVALKCAGDLDGAFQVLEATLRMAEPLGFLRTFVDRAPVMAKLLKALLERSPESTYIHRLLDGFEGKITSEAEQPTDASLSGGLTNRELDVLIMLEKRLSNKEIADRLFVSPETVKKHTANIYRKLHVSGRRQAVYAARKLGLLPAKSAALLNSLSTGVFTIGWRDSLFPLTHLLHMNQSSFPSSVA